MTVGGSTGTDNRACQSACGKDRSREQESLVPWHCQLEVFGSEADITRPFVVLCVIESKTGGTIFDRHSVDAAMDQLRPDACKCGADALLLIDMTKEGALSSFSAGWGRGMVKVKAIKWTGPR